MYKIKKLLQYLIGLLTKQTFEKRDNPRQNLYLGAFFLFGL
mgnify:CR=1 FL=1